jgi:hypothetical protein
MVFDDAVAFTGTLEACQAYIAEDEFPEELFIVAPDGFTVVE